MEPFNDRQPIQIQNLNCLCFLPIEWNGKTILSLLELITDMGRALPEAYTNRPTNVLTPECSISSQDGSDFPLNSITISHRPSTASAVDAFNGLLMNNVSNAMEKSGVSIFLMTSGI